MSQIKTIKQALQEAYAKIPANEAEILLALVLKQSQEWLVSHQEQTITTDNLNDFQQLVAKRLQGTPVAYLTGVKEFYGRPFKVTPDVLIPRPDSELIIEEALKYLSLITHNSLPITLLDIGTGSGCLIISIALETNNKFIYTGLDISDKALAIAQENAKALGAKVNFMQSNLLSGLNLPNYQLPITNYSLILANLPYLTSEQLSEPTIQQEPALALDGGKDGLHYIKQLLQQIPLYTKKGSLILIEIDPNQEETIQAETNKKLPAWQINFKKDLSGKTRVAILTPSEG